LFFFLHHAGKKYVFNSVQAVNRHQQIFLLQKAVPVLPYSIGKHTFYTFHAPDLSRGLILYCLAAAYHVCAQQLILKRIPPYPVHRVRKMVFYM
jgi:hypothetical protein